MEAVIKYLQANQDRFVEELCELVRIPSVSALPQHQKDMVTCASWLADHCRKIGLEAKVHPTPRHPIVIAQTPRSRAKRPRFNVYGHYDVQPVDPLDLWKSPPFEPRVENGVLFGRGASDNKGQLMAHLKAVEAYLKTGTELPCDLTFVLEGEEEVGSNSMPDFLQKNRKLLAGNAFVISDTGIPSLKHPAMTYALRGIIGCEIMVRGPSQDLHSGIFGGSVDNPAMALSQMLARLRDDKGRITIPGFYKDVAPLSAFERKQLARLPYNEKEYKKMLGVPKLFGEKGYTPIEQRTARPTLEINGLTSGYQGEGGKTIVPSWARAKITCRLVANQDADAVQQALVKHLKKLCPPTVTMELRFRGGSPPYMVSPTGAYAKAALVALEQAFGCQPVLMREGGSIPIVNKFKSILGMDSLLLGLALPDDNAHSPNEKFSLECYRRGMHMSAYLWPELAKA